MFTTHSNDHTTPEKPLAEPRMAVVVERSYDSITFHVARDPEFLQGVKDGRKLFPTDWDLSGKNGLWEVDDLLQFVRQELNPASQAKENELLACLEAQPHTPVYNLGLVAGLLALFAEATLNAEGREPQC
jgi:hypothetical protein